MGGEDLPTQGNIGIDLALTVGGDVAIRGRVAARDPRCRLKFTNRAPGQHAVGRSPATARKEEICALSRRS
jgi:hypothetical protein